MKIPHRHQSKSLMFYMKVLILNVFCLYAFLKILQIAMEPEISLGDADDTDISDIKPFEPLEVEDFPISDESGSTRIPRIIHQTWKELNIPTQFHDNIRSLYITHNPDFEYYFWTDASARKLIRDKFPHLLETFDNYVEPVRKADMLRYAVLYEFGGIYADLDTECVRPLERVLHKYACVISPEPYEHSALIYNSVFLVTNSVVFCRPGHPFLKMATDALPDFSHFSQDIDATGPNFLTYQYNIYQNDIKQSYLANSNRLDATKMRNAIFPRKQINDSSNKRNVSQNGVLVDETSDDFVFIPSSQYFQNDLDPVRFDQFKATCKHFQNLNSIAKRGCASLRRRGMKSRQSKFEYTRHSFSHTGYKWIPSSHVTIFELVKRAKVYD